jgi:hypothetical protein
VQTIPVPLSVMVPTTVTTLITRLIHIARPVILSVLHVLED